MEVYSSPLDSAKAIYILNLPLILSMKSPDDFESIFQI